MARSHMTWQFGVWRDPEHADTTKDERFLYMTLIADEALNQAGVVIMRPGVWAEDAAMSDDEVETALAGLERRRFVVVDRRTNELLVRTFIRNDKVAEQPNVLRNACEHAKLVRSPAIRRVLACELRKLPAKAEDKKLKSGRVFVHPDPHATADAIDPGPPTGGGECSPKGRGNPSRKPAPTIAPERPKEPSAEPFPEVTGDVVVDVEEEPSVSTHLAIKEAATRAPAREPSPQQYKVQAARLVGRHLPQWVSRGPRGRLADGVADGLARGISDAACQAALHRWAATDGVTPSGIDWMLDDAAKQENGSVRHGARNDRATAANVTALDSFIRGIEDDEANAANSLELQRGAS